MSREWLLYLARAASALGSWMTFLAVALFVNDKFGADKVAYAFLVSSMPALILSKKAYTTIPAKYQKKCYFVGLLLLSINVLLLTFADSIWHVYGYLLFASCISAYLGPLLDSLTAESFDESELDKILTKVGSITTSILCIAPPLGASLAVNIGYTAVYILDAMTFIICGILLFFVFKESPQFEKEFSNTKVIRKHFIKLKELDYPKNLQINLYFWYFVLILGALINAGEFGLFKLAAYSKPQIGYIVGSWGIGGLCAFFTAHINFSRYRRIVFLLYGFSLALFYLVPNFWLSCLIFVFAGLFSAKLGGMMRARIQSQIPKNMRSLEVWGLVNSRLSLINMLVYGSVGFLIPYWGVTWIAAPLVIASLIGGLLTQNNTPAESGSDRLQST